MKIAPFDENAFKMDHPRGTVSFNYLLMGDRSRPMDNYRYILGRQEADFLMPRHCHTFEQIRLPLVGDMNLGEQGILREGEVGYFPEGQTYGPQDDPLTDPKQLQLVLQFAGASALGMGAGRGRGPDNKEAQAERRAGARAAVPQAALQRRLSAAASGRAATLFNAGRRLGGAVGIAVATTALVLVGVDSPADGQPASDGAAYRVGFLVAAAVNLLALRAAWVVRDADAASTVPEARPRRPRRARSG
ncbi:hypothetical protein ACFVYG_27365 [Streptomyces sp. NPDC058256]|uniref:hypothetical protein n=1 Tax=Streptomyces sp. NPDC058256 TaxID=3346408 RepID=UPI0036E830BC